MSLRLAKRADDSKFSVTIASAVGRDDLMTTDRLRSVRLSRRARS